MSFIASGGPIALGGASFVTARKEDRILAAIPFLFGIQQDFEGIQWLYLNNGSSSLWAGYGFLLFAFIIWPIYVPLTVFVLDKKKRGILKWYVLLGIIIALYSIRQPLMQPLSIQKINKCITYAFNYQLEDYVTIAYVLAIFGPLFVSSRKIFRWFGIIFGFLAIISWIFFKVNFVSVWCFFAAIVSSIIFVYLKLKKKK